MQYVAMLRQKYVAHLLGSSIVGRLPNGMAPIAIAIHLRQQQAGYEVAGLFTAIYALSTAGGSPLLGRLVDRFGQPIVMLISAAGSAIGFFGAAFLPVDDYLPLGASVVLAGALTPPLEACLRSLWADILPKEQLEAGYALDSSTQQVIFISGPLLVAGGIAIAPSAYVVLATGMFGLIGVVVFCLAPPVWRWRPVHAERHWLGPLRSPLLTVVLVCNCGVGAAMGAFSILAVAYSEHVSLPSMNGVLLSANAVGAMIGGIVYGARVWQSRDSKRLLVLLGTLAALYLPLMLTPGAIAMTVLAFIGGLFLAPALTCSYVLVGRICPPGTVTEAFAWLVTIFLVGNAAGAATAGAAVSSLPINFAFGAMALFALVGFVIYVVGLRLIGSEASSTPTESEQSTAR